jgi:hypothetical protein
MHFVDIFDNETWNFIFSRKDINRYLATKIFHAIIKSENFIETKMNAQSNHQLSFKYERLLNTKIINALDKNKYGHFLDPKAQRNDISRCINKFCVETSKYTEKSAVPKKFCSKPCQVEFYKKTL